LAAERQGDSLEAWIVLRGTLPLTSLVSEVSQARRKSSTSGESTDAGHADGRARVPEVNLADPVCKTWGAAESGRDQEKHATVLVLSESARRNTGDASGDVQRRGEGGRGTRLTQAQCLRGEAEGAEESADGKAVHTGLRPHGAGLSPAGRLEQRYPANAQAVHGVLRGGGRKAKERFRVYGPGE
jgi:hypothetical protein